MGAWRPLKASPYSSPAIDRMKEALAIAIAERLEEDPAAEDVVKKCIRSARSAVLRDFREGNGTLYGMTRLAQTAEALGLRPELTFRRAS